MPWVILPATSPATSKGGWIAAKEAACDPLRMGYALLIQPTPSPRRKPALALSLWEICGVSLVPQTAKNPK
ncbi:hypothetical protein GFS31_12400 [Leptolyngbya sp. BL0902]|nr:hypothetical protein GFS31_12400 [Leptolyngbya sp. BL0902]